VVRVAPIGLLLLALTACGNDATSTPPPVERTARQVARAGVASVIVFVSDDGREYVATAGKQRPRPDQRFRVGSVTKTFTAAIVLQLAEEGRLRLADTLDRYLPGVVPKGKGITVRQLLQHRSGLANFTDDPSWLEEASRSPATRPIDSVRFAASQPLAFSPGSQWGYSNTNYIALGLIIEKVTGRTYADELEQRIIEPLRLEQTELPTSRRLRDLDDPGENPNVPWAAGALVSNAQDLSVFLRALLSGEILSDESLTQMKDTVPTGPGGLEDGLGLFSSHLRCGRFWGHDGGILDYATLVRASEDGDRVAVLSAHGGNPTGPPPDESALLCPAG
jgi:D-alanyl-D-alanine carboxypeptidase